MSSAAPSPHRALLPVGTCIVAIALFAVMDAFMKRASLHAGVYPALLLRSGMGVVVLGPAWRLTGGRWPRGEVLRVHALRSVIAAGMAATFFWGLVRTPMAEAMALSFMAPLIALYLAAVQLGETIRRDAVVGSLVGLAGVIVIGAARLGGSTGGPDAAWGIASILLSAVLYAWNLVLQRRQAQLAAPLEVALFQNLFVGLVLLVLAPLWWQAPPVGALFDIAGAAVLVSASLMLLAWSYARAEAQRLVPIEYTAFVWSALMGWLWFGEAVGWATLAGLVLILAGCWLGTRPDRSPPVPPA